MNNNSIVDNLSVASPCTASWAAMDGDERVRFCGQCQKNVYNVSAMTGQEIESLVLEKEGRLCIRFYQRKDGTVITEDCPRGLRLLRNGVRKISAALAAVVSLSLAVLPARAGDSTVSKCAKPEAENANHPVMGKMRAPENIKMGEMALAPIESPHEPWMDKYKASQLPLILANIQKDAKFENVNLFVTLDQSGKVLNSYIVPSTGNAELENKLLKAARSTAFPRLPVKSGNNVSLKFVVTQK